MKRKLTWLDHLLGTLYVMTIIEQIAAENYTAALGWGFALMWFTIHKLKTGKITVIMGKRGK